MAYIQQNTPPPNKIYTFSLQNFVGGLNNRNNVLQESECSNVLNMSFSHDDIVEKRRGSTQFDTLTLPDEVTFLDEFKPYVDENILIRATDKEIYMGNTKIRDVSGQVCGVNFNGKYYFVDGTGLYVYGKFPQESSTYSRVYGTPIESYIIMKIGSAPSDYTPLDTSHVEGVTVYDYGSKVLWYEPCENELADTFKQGNVIPDKPRFLVMKGGRLYVSGSDKDNDNVFISDINKPYYFPASLPIQLPPNSDRVVGLAVYDDAVICGRREDVHYITGSTNRTDVGEPVFQLKRLNTHTGFASNKAISNAHNYLFYLGSDGNVYALSNVTQSSTVMSTTLISRTLNIFQKPISVQKDDIYTACSIFFEDQLYLSIKDIILIYNYRTRSWTMYDNLHARSFYNYRNVLIWGDTKGRISMPSEDYLDYGIPYPAYWTSKQFDMDDANAQKQFREFFIVAHTFDDVSSDIRLNFEVDYVEVRTETFIQNQISIWGRAIFGDRFITKNINASVPFVIGRRGRNIRFTFINGYRPSAPVEVLEQLDTYPNRKNDTFVWVESEKAYYMYENATWHKMEPKDYNQAMRVYQMNGEYEYRGKR